MKRQIDKKLLFQILLAIAVCVLITIASGCRTGGVKLNPNSAGKIIQPKSPEQINKEVKAKREEAKKFENAKPQTIEPAKIEEHAYGSLQIHVWDIRTVTNPHVNDLFLSCVQFVSTPGETTCELVPIKRPEGVVLVSFVVIYVRIDQLVAVFF